MYKKVSVVTFLSILLLFAISSCSPVGGWIEKAKELERNGLITSAREQYIRVLEKDPENVEAIVGLKKIDEERFKTKLDEFRIAYNNQNYPEAYDLYDEIQEIKDEDAYYNIIMNIPASILRQYMTVKAALAEKHYEKGKNYYQSEDWSSTISELEKCNDFVEGYKNTQQLIKTSKARNYYSIGLSNYKSGCYEEAYENFDKCLEYDPGNKKARELKNNSVEKGRVDIAIFDFSNNSRDREVARSLYAQVLSELVSASKTDPFLRVIDRKHLSVLLREQNLAEYGVVDQQTATKTGRIIGVDQVIMGEVIEVSYDKTDNPPEGIDAYDFDIYSDSEGNARVRSDKTRFYLYEGDAKATVKFNLLKISVGTGQLVESEVITESKYDKFRFAKYNGDYSSLSLTRPPEDAVGAFIVNLISKPDSRLFTTRKRSLQSREELINETLESIARDIASRIR